MSIEVEECDYYASRERNKYLYLPYLDVSEQESLHYAGELARTHNSASKRIPGLFTFGWKYTEADYKEELLFCGITVRVLL